MIIIKADYGVRRGTEFDNLIKFWPSHIMGFDEWIRQNNGNTVRINNRFLVRVEFGEKEYLQFLLKNHD